MSPVELNHSGIRHLLVIGLVLAGLLSCIALADSARPLWVLPGWLLLWRATTRMIGDPAAGLLICWEEGNWCLQRGEQRWCARLLPGAVLLSWAVRVEFQQQPGGRRLALLLFGDSGEPAALRRLRRRITLCSEHPRAAFSPR